ncbi:hypothetical protein ABZS61_09675 [Streptomyces sp. NPDC005566]|uniref:hypothetical protein n=1 Tax=Streptomyces sp. NPDC005566 TaxID=3156886 RepID=UPI0033B527FB
MHGYGYPPEQQPRRRPSQATLVTLRVVFVALTMLSCGFLAWAAMLRLAIVTRRKLDWYLLALVFVLNVGLIVFFGTLPDDPDEMTDSEALLGIGWLFVVLAGTVTYYLYADIRHFGPYGGSRPGPSPLPYGGYVPQQTVAVAPTTPRPTYGYPPVPTPPAQPPAATPPPTPATPPPAGPSPASPQRLDQVRAELDELSDYLRKEGGSR